MPTTEYGVDAFFQNAGTSPKMVYDVAGVLGWSPHNRLTQSQTFNTSWTTLNTTVVANQAIAPDGTTTMDLVYPTTTGVNRWIAGVAGAATPAGMIPVSVSVYAKMAGKRWIAFLKFDGSATGAWFDLQNGVVGTVVAGYTSAIQDVGSGIYRCTITSNVTTVFSYQNILITDADNSTTATTNGTDGVYLWGAQLNNGPVATAYLPTTTAARFGLALDYDPVTHAARGLLCEPAATNLLVQNSAFNTGWLISNVTIGADSTTAPDGSMTADKVSDDATNSNHSVYKGSALTAAAYTFSVYLKAADRNWAALGLYTTSLPTAYFNLASGTIGTVSGGATATMVSVGNGWYRCSVTQTATAVTWYTLIFTAPSDNVFSYVGNGTGIYAWGAQLETGTVATSPIPTFAASATRAGDQYSVTPTSINYSATAGSWWVEHYQIGGVGTNPRILAYSSGAYLYTTETTVYGLNDGTILSKSGVPTATGNTQRVACAFQSGDRALTATGLTAATDTGSTALLLAPGAVIITGGSGATLMRGYIRKVRYVPRRKTNAELVTETTP